MNTAQRLGYGKEEKLLIVNADDFGLCGSVNETIVELLASGAVCSATVMMCCSWSADAIARVLGTVPNADVGVHWTLTSEWPGYKWGPVCRTRPMITLAARGGWFPGTVAEIERTADPEEVRCELIAQTEAAIASGLSPTHADNHMASLYGLYSGKDLLSVVFDICAKYGLPFRLPRTLIPVGGRTIPAELQERAKRRVRQADDRGIVLPDYIVGPEYGLNEGDTYEAVKREGIALLRGLLPGVTEWIAHPAKSAPELTAFHGQPAKREMERRFWLDEDVRRITAEERIRFIGWRELQLLQKELSA
ncbi:polysaccharide deacetylase family protein [Cohnella cellulosilytica]|uniref:Polysaccharide deacetylase family protein n=1 Tax=Cohnella cellulosilytica TaxID=986710 RepID=A0ABW2F4U7_9BACL